MLGETEWIFERWQLFKLVNDHPDWSLRSYARELHHDPKWVHKWLHRFREHRLPTMELFKGHSRRPKHSPRQLAKQVKDQVGQLREELSERFHRAAGAKTIRHFLAKAAADQARVPGLSSIYRILRERSYIHKPPPATHEPLDLPAPNEEWEFDFGEIYLGPVEGTLEFLLVVDRGTSRVIHLEGSVGYNAERALEAIGRVLAQHGLPKRLRFDRDSRLWGSWSRDSYPSPLIRFLHALGIQPVICPPHRPDKKPFVERCIGTLKHEWLARYSPTTLADGLALLEPFLSYYHQQRPHQGQACADRTPDEAFPSLSALPALPARVNPDAWLEVEQGHVYRRRVSAGGTIQIDKHSYYVGQALAGTLVLVHLDGRAATFHITDNGRLVCSLPIKGLYQTELALGHFLELLKAEARTIEQYRIAHWQQTGEVA